MFKVTIEVRDPWGIVCALRDEMRKLDELDRESRKQEPGLLITVDAAEERERWSSMHHACRDAMMQFAKAGDRNAIGILEELDLKRDAKRMNKET